MLTNIFKKRIVINSLKFIFKNDFRVQEIAFLYKKREKRILTNVLKEFHSNNLKFTFQKDLESKKPFL